MPGLLATKLHQPALPARQVLRPRLLRQLNEGLAADRPLTLVSAPAGFGKSTAIAEWLHALHAQVPPIPSAWLSLDPADNDPARFWSYLLAALGQLIPEVGAELAALARPGPLPAPELLWATLLEVLTPVAGPRVLALDDLHLLHEPSLLRLLEQLVAHPAPALHLVLLTREDPSLPLARLRAHNQLTELRAAELRFTSAEAEQFLHEVMGLGLSNGEVALLEERTEGWVVGLQLAALSVKDRPDPGSFLAQLKGTHRYILSYLTEEVLSRQPEEIQAFLLRTSILERLCAPLCDELLKDEGGRMKAEDSDGRPSSNPQSAISTHQSAIPFILPPSSFILSSLERSNLFLLPLDEEGEWFRYHHLFADLLRARLKQTLPAETIRELHRRASDWLATNDFIDQAVWHALEGQDFARAVALIEQSARTMMFTGRVNLLKSWLDSIPEAVFESFPHLKIYRVWIDLLQGKQDLSEYAMQETDRKLDALPPTPENQALRVELMVILCRFMALMGSPERAIRYAEEALRFLPESDLPSRTRVYSGLAAAYMLQGKLDQAEPAYRECLSLAKACGYDALAAHTIMVTNMGLIQYGRLHEARQAFQSILAMPPAPGQKVFHPAGQGYIGLASISLEWNDLETAEGYLKQGMELCGQAGLDGVYTGYVLKARLRQARGDFAGALEEIHTLEKVFQRKDPAPTGQLIQVLLAMGEVDEAVRQAGLLIQLLEPGPGAPHYPLLALEALKAIVIRVYIAQGKINDALRLLDDLQSTAEPGGRWGRMIEVHLLRALALTKQNGGKATAQARREFARALELGQPEGYIRVFLDESPAVNPLLQAVLRDPSVPETSRTFARKLCESLGEKAPAWEPEIQAAAPDQELVEPLSLREMEILALIEAGCSNQEIAERLVITLHTVKKHSSNIFAKLGVASRTQAVARARELGLIR